MTRAILLAMAVSKANLASMVKRTMLLLVRAIVESEAKPFALFRSGFEELLRNQMPVFALAFTFSMLTISLGRQLTPHHAWPY